MFVCVITMGTVVSVCTNREKQNSTSLPNISSMSSPSGMNQSGDEMADVPTLVRTFSEDVGERGENAWKKLQAYPREKLIESLLRLRKNVPEDDLRQYSIAFTLASLNYQYADNVAVLARSLTPKPNESADSVAMMLARLVRGGDKNLLPVLLSSAPSSDAALSEALSDIFAQEVRAEPKEFLAQLSKQSKSARLRVYSLTKDGALTESDIRELRKQLTVLSRDASVSRIAREMLSSSIFDK
jgi:hypothetical protein